MSDTPKTRCEGYRRYGGAFTMGRPIWEQCRNAAIVLLTIEQKGEVLTDSPTCAECWEEGRKAGIKQLEAKPITNHGTSKTPG